MLLIFLLICVIICLCVLICKSTKTEKERAKKELANNKIKDFFRKRKYFIIGTSVFVGICFLMYITNNKVSYNFKAFGSGVKDAVTDLNFWTFGIRDLTNNLQAKTVVEKYGRGEKLEESEEAIMDALYLLKMVKWLRKDDISNWYLAGKQIDIILFIVIVICIYRKEIYRKIK